MNASGKVTNPGTGPAAEPVDKENGSKSKATSSTLSGSFWHLFGVGEIRSKVKMTQQGKVGSMFIALGLALFWFFLPDSALQFIEARASAFGRLVFQLGAGVLLPASFSWLLFASDPLATGTDKEAEFFRSQYASQFFVDRFKVGEGIEKHMWFTLFNSWANPQHRMHDGYVRTFERSYSCRLLVYLRRGLWVFVTFGLLLTSWPFIIRHFAMIEARTVQDILLSGEFLARSLLVAIALLVLLYLYGTNRLPNERHSRPSGCWWKWREINQMHMAFLEDLMRNCQSYEEAWVAIGNAILPEGSRASTPSATNAIAKS